MNLGDLPEAQLATITLMLWAAGTPLGVEHAHGEGVPPLAQVRGVPPIVIAAEYDSGRPGCYRYSAARRPLRIPPLPEFLP